MTNEQSQPMTFDNGMTEAERDAADDLRIEIKKIILSIEDLPRHRNYSLVITKLEEADHWLRDRAHKPA